MLKNDYKTQKIIINIFSIKNVSNYRFPNYAIKNEHLILK